MATKPSLRDRLIGAWKLESYLQVFDDGRPAELPMSTKPRGWILYTSDGCMSAQLCPAGRARFRSDIITKGESSEYADAARNFISYCGRFTCDDNASTVTHHVDVSLFPNWVGTDQLRALEMKDDLLTLSTVPGQPGSQSGVLQTLVWRRAQ